MGREVGVETHSSNNPNNKNNKNNTATQPKSPDCSKGSHKGEGVEGSEVRESNVHLLAFWFIGSRNN